MNKFQILGSALATVAVLSLGSCASDEPVNSAAGQQSTGKGITFTAERANEDAAKRTYYGEALDGQLSVYWSADDQISIFSPAAGEVADQQGVFTSASDLANEQAIAGFTGSGVNWNLSVATQDFYAYYPASAVGDGKISINSDGSATFAVPADQSIIAEQVAATVATDATHPLAYAIAAATGVAVNEESSVSMVFNDFMNVLRLKINTDESYTINSVVISSATSEQNVAGNIVVTPTDAVTTTTCAFGAITDGSTSITVVPTTADAANFVFNVYLLPQDYTEGINITINYTDGTAKDIVKTTQPFAKSTVKDVIINMSTAPGGDGVARTPLNSVDLGIRVVNGVAGNGAILTNWIGKADGTLGFNINGATGAINFTPANAVPANAKTLYFANGNLHIPASATPEQLASGNMGQIASVTADNLASLNITTTGGYSYGTKDNGLFLWGDANVTGSVPAALATGDIHISGTEYDIAAKQLGSGWRLPTAMEWAFLVEMVAPTAIYSGSGYRSWGMYNGYAVEYTQGALGSSFNTGIGVLTLTSTVEGFEESIFLPALGRSDLEGSNPANTRKESGWYWSGSFSHNNESRGFSFNPANANSWYMHYTHRSYGTSVRPVYTEE